MKKRENYDEEKEEWTNADTYINAFTSTIKLWQFNLFDQPYQTRNDIIIYGMV